MLKPVFARPKSVIPLSDRSAYIALLKEFRVPYKEWNKKTFEKRCREVEEGDAVYTTTHDFFPDEVYSRLMPNMPLRFIITASARVTTVVNEETFILVERVYNGDTDMFDPRKYDGSISEKAKLAPLTGKLFCPLVSTIKRCLSEEANINVSEALVSRRLQFRPWPPDAMRKPIAPTHLMGGAVGIEQDSREKKMEPGVWSFNQIAHYYLALPPSVYFPSFRRVVGTPYLCRWTSAMHEDLDPIPAQFVLFNERASA